MLRWESSKKEIAAQFRPLRKNHNNKIPLEELDSGTGWFDETSFKIFELLRAVMAYFICG